MNEKIKKIFINAFCFLVGFFFGFCTNLLYNRTATKDIREQLAEAERTNNILERKLGEAISTIEGQLDRVRELENTIRSSENIYAEIRKQKVEK